MFTIFGATHTLTQEMMVLIAALAVFLLGIVLIAVDVVRRNQRRIEAENKPIDTSIFQNLPPGDAAPEEAAPLPEEETLPAKAVEAPTPEPAPEEPAPTAEAAPAPEQVFEQPVFATAEPAAPAEPEAAHFTAPAPASLPVLVCENFGAGFGDKIVLADVTLTVLDQGITTLMGPAGTGKSTLLRALAGMLSQSGLFKSWGTAYFRGAPLGPDNRPLLVAQRIQLIRRTALDNLTFHLRDRTADLPVEKQRQWASQWLDQAGAGDVIALLDRPFMELDQLSQRIVTILREAAAEPALLLIDEPTTGLSESDAAVLLVMLERLAGFTPLLVALQNHKHARKISSQIILLAGGRVQAACGAESFFDTPPTPAVAQFLATGACAVPAPDAAGIKPAADPAAPPPLSAAPPPLSAAALEAIKDEIRTALAVEMTQEPAAAEPEPVAYEPGPAAAEMTAEPETVAYEPEPELAEPLPETETAAAEPLPEPEAAPEPAAYEPEPATPEVELAAAEPEAEPEPLPEREPAPAEIAAAESESHETESVSEPAPEPLPAFAAPEAELAAPEAEPIPAEPAPEPLPEPVAYEPEPEPAVHAAEPSPEPAAHIPEPDVYEAEPLAERVTYTPRTAAEPAVIDMDATLPEGEAPDDSSSLDDLPPISLSAQMIQTVPLPPRAATAQMTAGGAYDPQRHEHAAVTRYPGSAAPGPRGFVWIEDGRLAATPMPGISASIDQDLTMLKLAGVTVLITLTEQNFPQDILAQHGLRNVHFPIADRKAPSTGETDVLVGQMHDMLNRGEVLAVHCLAGLGRTGTILAAYMVKEKGVSAQVALNQIRHFNRQFVQTDDQEDFLTEYEVQQEQTVLRNRATDGSKFS